MTVINAGGERLSRVGYGQITTEAVPVSGLFRRGIEGNLLGHPSVMVGRRAIGRHIGQVECAGMGITTEPRTMQHMKDSPVRPPYQHLERVGREGLRFVRLSA